MRDRLARKSHQLHQLSSRVHRRPQQEQEVGEICGLDVRIGQAPGRSIVSLRVSRQAAGDAVRCLDLGPPLCAAGEDPQSLWLGPDHWLLVSRLQSVSAMIDRCATGLPGLLHNAVDQSAAYAVLRIEGRGAREVLASGSGLDLRERNLARGSCRPTRLAQVAAVIVAAGADSFELYVDRGYGKYLLDWLEDSLAIANRAVREST